VRNLDSIWGVRVGLPLRIHTGIESGPVISGATDARQGEEGFAGQSITIASRLTDLAEPDEILVGPAAYGLTKNHHAFEPLPPKAIKGLSHPLLFYRLVHGEGRGAAEGGEMRKEAPFVGRTWEMEALEKALDRVLKGDRSILALRGEAGSGKSRLLRHSRRRLAPGRVQWLEGRAMSSTQSSAYAPLKDLLARALGIEEQAPAKTIGQRVEEALRPLGLASDRLVSLLGTLYMLEQRGEPRDSETWKRRLHEAVRETLAALSARAPTVICLEDLHWADTPSLELLRELLLEGDIRAFFLLTYRPPFTLFPEGTEGWLGKDYQEIPLAELSFAEAIELLSGLLGQPEVPETLAVLVRDKVERNPFYLEEVAYAFLSGPGTPPDEGPGSKPLWPSGIPHTVQGLLTSRMDRLHSRARRALQEASVIGSLFSRTVLRQVTILGPEELATALAQLEEAGFLIPRLTPDGMQYTFRHTLTQEVAYTSLLKAERARIHERVGRALEAVAQDRLPEYYEALAAHFGRGLTAEKAVHYLLKAAEKNLACHALEVSHRYFEEAFNLALPRAGLGPEEKLRLVEILNAWAFVFYYRGDYKGLAQLLETHQDMAGSLEDPKAVGAYHAWLGAAFFSRERFREAHAYLTQALQMGEAAQDPFTIAFSNNWLTWTCSEMGRLEEAEACGRRALAQAERLGSKDFLFWNTLAGMAHVSWYKGKARETRLLAQRLLQESGEADNIRGIGLGHGFLGCSLLADGDHSRAVQAFDRALEFLEDPHYSHWVRMLRALCLALDGRFPEAEQCIQGILSNAERFGFEIIGTPARAIQAICLAGCGRLGRGLDLLNEMKERFRLTGRMWCHALAEHILGNFYLQVTLRGGSHVPPLSLREIPFLLRTLPFASRKAREHFSQCRQQAAAMGAQALEAMALMGLGLLNSRKGLRQEARRCLEEALSLFEDLGAEQNAREARQALDALS